MGLAILKGKVLYADIMDQKGPVLYLIEALGQWIIPGRAGLFMLATVFLSVAIFCWYKIARFFTTPAKSIIAIVLTLLSYYLFVQRGNLSEDWNITFVSIAYYLLLDFLLNEQKKKVLLNGLFIGVCFACSFFIRLNDAVAFIGAPILGVGIWEIKEKRMKEFLKWVAGILLGFTLITLPIIIWFAANSALTDLWYGIFGFNTKYVSGIDGMIKGSGDIMKFNYIPFLVTLLVLSWKSAFPRTLYLLIPTAIAAYFLLGTRCYLHYWIVWIPILFLTYWIFTLNQDNKLITVISICVFLSIPVFESQKWIDIPNHMFYDFKRDLNYNDSLYEKSAPLFVNLPENDKDSIWGYNLTWHGDNKQAFNVFIVNQIVPCNRVPLVFMADIAPALLKDMDITTTNPKYILFSSQNDLPPTYYKDSLYIRENYHSIRTIDNLGLILYQRKDEK